MFISRNGPISRLIANTLSFLVMTSNVMVPGLRADAGGLALSALQITQSADAPQVRPADPVGFAITVLNMSPEWAHEVKVTDTLPNIGTWKIDGGSYANFTTCQIEGNLLSCDAANIPGSSSFTIHLSAKSTEDKPTGFVTNTVQLSDSDASCLRNPAQCSATTRVEVVAAQAPLDLVHQGPSASFSAPETTPGLRAVNVVIKGKGSISSVPSFTCESASCSHNFLSSTTVTMTAKAASGHLFTGWSGDCSGIGACVLGASTKAQNIGATFVDASGFVAPGSSSSAAQDSATSSSTGPAAAVSSAAPSSNTRLLVKMRRGFGDSDARAAIASGHGTPRTAINALGVHIVNVPSDAANTSINTLRHDRRIANVEQDHTRQAASAPNDPSYPLQWSLPKIGWDQVYGVMNPTGTATIAVLDTGVQSADLLTVAGWSAFGNDPSVDPNGHGTAIASIAAASTDNLMGIAGVGFSGISIMPVQVLAANGSGQDSDIIAGIIWAADHGANVIVMAFAGPGASQALEDGIAYAWSKGVVVVAAAGNDGSTTPTYPAGAPDVVGVGATDENDAMWSGSNVSPSVFITAPGVGISVDTTDGSTTSVTGTSASAAIVAGAVALLKAGDPSATPGTIVGRIVRGADQGGMAHGRVNLVKAITDVSTAEMTPQGVAGNGSAGPYQAANRVVNVTIVGSGRVVNSNGTIDCGVGSPNNDCVMNSSNATITMTATATSGWTFTGYSGACTGLTCTLSDNSGGQPQNVTATFTAVSRTVNVTIVGNGTVTSTAGSPAISCSSGTCTSSSNTNYTLTATPTAGSTFAGWSGACSGTGTCPLTNAGATQSVTATYKFASSVTITCNPNTFVYNRTAQTPTCTATYTTSDGLNGSATLSYSNNTNVGTATATGTYAGDSTHNGSTGTANFTITKAPVTINFVANNKQYDGGTSATAASCSIASGVIAGDTVTCSTSGAVVSFADKFIGNAKPVTATSGFATSGTNGGNYQITTINPSTANITAKSLTVSFVAADKVYDQTNAAVINSCSVTGVVSPETVTCDKTAATATFPNKSVGTNRTVTAAGFALAGANAANYVIGTTNTDTATISAKPVTLTYTVTDKTYTGGTGATIHDCTITGGVINGDTVTCSPSGTNGTFSDRNVAQNKSVTATSSSFSLGGTDGGNYSAPSSNAGTGNIVPKALTVNFTASNKPYDGTTTATVSACSYVTSGLVGGDSTSSVTCVPSSGTANFSSAAIGSHTVTATGFTFSGTNGGNYTASPINSTTASITAKTLTFTFTVNSKVYNGSAAATLASCALTGVTPGDDVSCSGTATFSDKNVGTNKLVNGTGFTLSGANASSYTLTSTTGTTHADISAKPLDLTVTTASKVYNGNNTAQILGCSIGAGTVVAGDTVTCNTSGASLTFPSKNVGTNLAIAQSGFTLSGASIANYSVNSVTPSPAFADITPRGLNIQAQAFDKQYDGNTDASVNLSDFRIFGDNLDVNYATASFSDATVGNGKTVTVSGITVTGADVGNYLFGDTVTTTANITPIMLTVTAQDTSRLYGANNPAFTWSIDGFINGETLATSDIQGEPSCTTTATAASHAGTYAIACTVGTLTSSHYGFNFVPATLTIDKAPLAVTVDLLPGTPDVDHFSRSYGQANPSFGVRFDGFVNSDTQANLTGSLLYSTSATPASAPGPYAVAVSGLSSQDYTIAYFDGVLDVTKATLTVTADSTSKNYGDAIPALTATLSGFANGQSLGTSDVSGSADCATTATAASGAGTYAITCIAGSLSSTNYAFTFATGTLSIGTATLQVIVDAQPGTDAVDHFSRLYGQANPSFSVRYAGFVNGDDASSLGGALVYTTLADESSAPGTYSISASGLSSSNYTIAYTDGVLDVSQATLTVTANDAHKNYGAALPAFSATITGFANGQDLGTSDVTGEASCTTTATASSPAGNYPINCQVGLLASSNYTFSFAAGTLTIDPVPLTITVDALPGSAGVHHFSRAYGQANPLFDKRIEGLVNGDTEANLLGTLVYSTPAIATSAPGAYSVSASGLSSPNYTIAYADGVLDIGKATLTVKADDQSMGYGGPLPTLTNTISGFANGEALGTSDVSGTAACSTTATALSPTGGYTISCTSGGLSSTNYSFTFASGTLTITNANLTVTVDHSSRLYGEANPTFTAHIDGFVNGDNESALGGTLAFSTLADANSAPGSYAVSASGLTSSNYAIQYVDGTLDIGKATLLVTADSVHKNYGAALPAFTATISGFANSETLGTSGVTGSASCTSTATAASSFGVYTIACTTGGLSSANYTFDFAPGSLTIDTVPLTITVDALPAIAGVHHFVRAYGQANPLFDKRIEGLVNGDTEANLVGALAYSTASNATSAPGPYAVSASGLSSPNYAIAYVDGVLDVGQATLTITGDNQNINYGDAIPSLTATMSGFANGETLATSGVSGTPDCTTAATASSPVGPYAISCTIGSLSSTNYAFSFAAGTLNIGTSTLTVTVDALPGTPDNDGFSKTYGDANPAFNVRYDGFLNGDDASALGGTLSYATSATAASPAGVYVVKASGLTSSNYNIVYVDGSLEIKKAALTVTVDSITGTEAADPFSRPYGAANPTFTVRYVGFVNGDTDTSLSGTLAFSTSAIATSPVGSYTVSANGLSSLNYDIAYVDGSLNVTTADLSVTVDADANTPGIDHFTKAFGQPNPGFGVRYNGFANGESESVLSGSLSFTTAANDASAVGSYPVSASGLTSTNYNIHFVDGALDVGQAPLTITVDPSSKTYGQANPTFTAQYAGFLNGDNETSLSGTLAFATTANTSSPAGNYAVSASGLTSTNYAITFVDGTLTVGKAPLTVTVDANNTTPADDAFSKTYGQPNPAFSVRIDGLVNGDTEVSLAGTLAFTTAATASSSVGSYPVSASGLTSTNYDINYVDGTLNITPANLNIAVDAVVGTPANDTFSKVYGAANPAFSARLDGLVNGDTQASLAGTLAFTTTATAASAVGSYPVSASGLASTNYLITYTDGDLEVVKAPLSITVDSDANTATVDHFTKAFGAPNPSFGVRFDGLVNGDTEASLVGSLVYTTTATDTSAAGTYPVSASGLTSTNYTIAYVDGVLDIGLVPLTVTVNPSSKTYGTTNPTFSVQYAGFVNGDTEATLGGALAFATTANASSPVGNYVVSASGLTSSNYAITFVDGNLEITPANLSVVVDALVGTPATDSFSKTYGAANPAFSIRLDGLLNGDSQASLVGTLAFSTTASASSAVGSYVVSASGLSSPNYIITYVDGDLEITKAPLSVTVDADANTATIDHFSKSFGAPNPAFGVRYNGFVNSDSEASLLGTLAFATTATNTSAAGSYPVSASGLASTNYTITYTDGVLDIGLVPLTITVNPSTKTYGEANPTFTVQYAGFLNGDTEATLGGTLAFATTALASSPVGDYVVSASGLTSSNYAITYVDGSLTVNKAALTATVDAAPGTPADEHFTKTFGQANPTFQVRLDGLLNGDTAASLGTPAFATTATTASPVGTYAVTASGLTSPNYTINYVAGNLDVTKAALNVTVDANAATAAIDHFNRAFGAANPSFSVRYVGFVNGNTPASLGGALIYTTAAMATSPAGTYPVSASGLTSPNYDITYTDGALDVGTATLTVTVNPATKIYGAANPGFTVQYAGFLNGDTAAGLGGTLAFTTTAMASSAVGSYPVNASGLTSSNYTINYVAGNLVINKADLNIVVNNSAKAFGAANPAFSVQYNGLVNGDTQASLGGALVFTTTATPSSPVGTYAVSASGLSSANYTISYTDGVLDVALAPLTVTVDPSNKTYGDVNPAFTVQYAGFVNGDTAASLGGTLAFATTATTASPVGSYTVSASGQTSANYTITYVDGSLTVGKAPLIITVDADPSTPANDDFSKAYGQPDPVLTDRVEGLVNGDTIASLGVTIDTTATATSAVGSYPVTLTAAAASNYTIATVNGVLNVTKATLTLNVDNKPISEGSAIPALSWNMTGFANGDNLASSGVTTPVCTTTATQNSPVGTYPITCTADASGSSNYTLELGTTGSVVINPAVVVTPPTGAPPVLVDTGCSAMNTDSVSGDMMVLLMLLALFGIRRRLMVRERARK